MEFDLKFKISSGKNLALGEDLSTCQESTKISGRISGQISEQILEKIFGNYFVTFVGNFVQQKGGANKPGCLHFFGLAPLQKVVRDFCCTNFGGFCRGFSWRIFLGTLSHKNEEKKSGEKKSGEKICPKIKIREKSVLPGTDRKIQVHRKGAFFRVKG